MLSAPKEPLQLLCVMMLHGVEMWLSGLVNGELSDGNRE